MKTLGLAMALFLGLFISTLYELEQRDWSQFRNPKSIDVFKGIDVFKPRFLISNPKFEQPLLGADIVRYAAKVKPQTVFSQKGTRINPKLTAQFKSKPGLAANNKEDSIETTAQILAEIVPAAGAALMGLVDNDALPIQRADSKASPQNFLQNTLAVSAIENAVIAKSKPALLSFNGGYLWRRQNNLSDTPGLDKLLPNTLATGYTGGETVLRLGPKWAATASLFTGLETDLLPDHQSAQATLGLRWTPLSTLNAHLSTGRLIKAGDAARNAWILRAATSAGVGYDRPQGKDFWGHWHSYGDVALIGARNRDVLATGAARFGAGLALDAKTSVLFTLGGEATFQHVEQATSLAEIGPSVLVRWRPGPENLLLDLRLGYRHKIAGNSDANNGVQLFLGVNY